MHALSEVEGVRGNWVECGKVGRPWGLKGHISVFWNSGTCPVRIGCGMVYARESDGEYVPHLVLSSRSKGARSVVLFEGLKNPKDAAALVNRKLYLPEEELPRLPEGEFYCYQILGLSVETQLGETIGTVTNIFSTGSNDVYEIKPASGNGPTILIPAIKDVIIKVDVENGKIIIRPMEGMLD